MADQDETPNTLAGLRLQARRPRVPSPPASGPPQLGLLFSPAPQPPIAPEAPPTSTRLEPDSQPDRGRSRYPSPDLEPASGAPAIPATPERRIWSVRSLVADIRQRIELGYADLWVEGEISNCRPAPSGHIYLTLKDGEAQLPVVLFRRQAQLLRFRPADGLAVLVRGRISVYDTRGQLQLIAETMEPRGAGALQLAFEQLKARLLAEGLFDAARKRPLPAYPRCIGIVTSRSGAVLRDILTVVRRRHARLNLLIYPATMQGTSCPGSVARAIRWFNAHPEKVDLILVARGGGSPEDLAGFNDEALARTVAASKLPVVSAIGHETDFTIADFVSDLRAPTPSAAAEIITAAQHRIGERLDNLHRSVLRAGRFHLLHARQRFARLSSAHVLARVYDAIARRQQRIDDLHQRLASATARRLSLGAQRLEILTARLLKQDPARRLLAGRHRLAQSRQCLDRAARQILASRHNRLDRATARLQALSPVSVLSRGYALVYIESGVAAGTLLRDTRNVAPGDRLLARLGNGSLTARVLAATPAADPSIEHPRTRITTRRTRNRSGDTTAMKKLFGTDGIRGIAGQSPLDPRTVYAIGLALAHSLKSGTNVPQVILGQDTRESSNWIVATLTAGLDAGGASVENAGVITTPAIAFLTREHGFAAGIVISASHNPWEDNGIKLFGPDGYKLPDSTEMSIEEEIFRALERPSESSASQAHDHRDLDPPPVNESDRAEYVRFLLAAVPGLSLENQTIVVDCANGAASAVAAQLFAGLGGEVIITHASPTGRNINEDCGALYPQVVAAEVVEQGASLGITLDGDADRCLLADEHGRVVNGDAILLLAARDLHTRGLLTGNTVVATTMSNMGLEAALKRSGISMLRAPVGDKYVLEEMQRTGAALGGEQSGHVIFSGRSTTGDGLLTALLVLDILHRAGKSLAELTSDLKVFPQIIVNVKVRERRPLNSIPPVAEAIRVAETDLADSGRVVIRYSGTETLARVMIEAESELAMRTHAENIANAIRSEIGL